MPSEEDVAALGLPWAVSRNGYTPGDELDIVTEDGLPVAAIEVSALQVAQAEYIVRAVNNHRSLVDALTRLTEEASLLHVHVLSGATPSRGEWSDLGKLVEQSREALIRLEASVYAKG